MLIGIVLRAMFIALATLPVTGTLVASADDGPPRAQDAAGRAPLTVLRSAGAAHREVVVVVGGLGSDANDGAFDRLIATLGPERYDFVRFGADPAHPYDTFGPIEASARELSAAVRAVAPRYDAVHLVTHSMGAAVVDRAFAGGLSAADGVRTYVALSPPHNRSTISRMATGVLALAGDDDVVVRAGFSPLVDPGAPAIADLAALTPDPPPAGVARIDVRLATDQLVLSRDAMSPGVEQRTLLPRELRGIEGHGGALSDPRVLGLARDTIALERVPEDDRGATELALTRAVSGANDRGAGAALDVLVVLVAAVLVRLRMAPALSRLVARPLARRVLEAR